MSVMLPNMNLVYIIYRYIILLLLYILLYVGDAAQHEPGRPVEVDDGGVGPGHGLGNSLIGQLSSTVQIKHLTKNDFK